MNEGRKPTEDHEKERASSRYSLQRGCESSCLAQVSAQPRWGAQVVSCSVAWRLYLRVGSNRTQTETTVFAR